MRTGELKLEQFIGKLSYCSSRRKKLPVGRVEESYLLVDTSSINVKTVLVDDAGMTLPDFWHILIVKRTVLQRITVKTMNSLVST